MSHTDPAWRRVGLPASPATRITHKPIAVKYDSSRGRARVPDRVSVGRQEFQAFLAENQELVERYQKLLDKLGSLRKLNMDLEEKLRLAVGIP